MLNKGRIFKHFFSPSRPSSLFEFLFKYSRISYVLLVDLDPLAFPLLVVVLLLRNLLPHKLLVDNRHNVVEE